MGCGQSLTTVKQESIDRRSASGMLENLVHEEFDKDISEFYDVDDSHILGEGISGQVRICTHKKTGQSYALKTLWKYNMSGSQVKALREEVRIMAALDHPNILRINECFEDRESIKLILELCEGGELLDRLHSQTRQKYTEKVACRYVLSMIRAIRYLHDHHIVHRDIKLENFLFETAHEDSELILIDFGLSQNLYHNAVLLNRAGTPFYIAPEVMKGLGYDNKCDIWSVGVIAYMLLSGTPPFCGKTDADTMHAVQKGQLKFHLNLFANISIEAKDFIKQCLNRKVSLRPSADMLLNHPWFTDLNEQSHSLLPPLNIMTRLVAFSARAALTKVCMEVVAHSLDTEQISSLRTEFKALDTHNRGEILFSELKKILQRDYEIADVHMQAMLKSSEDAPDDLVIKYHEFLASTISRQNINDHNMRVAFEKMSDHGDVITHASILDLLGSSAGDETVSRMMREVDVDPDSAINFDKFKTIMRGGAESPAISNSQRSPMNLFRQHSPSGRSSGSPHNMFNSSPKSFRNSRGARGLNAVEEEVEAVSPPSKVSVSPHRTEGVLSPQSRTPDAGALQLEDFDSVCHETASMGRRELGLTVDTTLSVI